MSRALDEGRRRVTEMSKSVGVSDDIAAWYPVGFESGAQWQREQEPTDAEVGAVQKCLYERTLTWVPTVEVRAALNAARVARRDEEKR